MAEYDYTTQPGRPWARLLIIVGLLILLGVLIWAVFFHNSSEGGSPSQGTSASQQSSNKSSQSNNKSNSGTSSSNKNSSTSTDKSSQQTTSDTAKKNAQATQSLTDAGPGDTFATFAVAAILGAVAYQLVLRRRRIRLDDTQ